MTHCPHLSAVILLASLLGRLLYMLISPRLVSCPSLCHTHLMDTPTISLNSKLLFIWLRPPNVMSNVVMVTNHFSWHWAMFLQVLVGVAGCSAGGRLQTVLSPLWLELSCSCHSWAHRNVVPTQQSAEECVLYVMIPSCSASFPLDALVHFLDYFSDCMFFCTIFVEATSPFPATPLVTPSHITFSLLMLTPCFSHHSGTTPMYLLATTCKILPSHVDIIWSIYEADLLKNSNFSVS